MVEAGRQAAIEMKEAKYLREEEAAGDDAKDDGEANTDGDMFKKTTYKNSKFAHQKGFGGGMKSFARKRKRIS